MTEEEEQPNLFSLKRAINANYGFYFLIAGSNTQKHIISNLNNPTIAIHDFATQGKQLIEMLNLMDNYPDKRVYVYLNFQEAFLSEDRLAWNADVARRLDFCRNGLSSIIHRKNKVMIFCMTPELDDLLCRRAMNFYDYVKLKIRFI